ncbi:MAG: hypothetical protein JO170_15810 [Verrucomicrobia bacterium]|nr:hypothetical protein [Verrucomicrobiota bacterium]
MDLTAVFTGNPRIGTSAAIVAHSDQKPLSLDEVTQVAHSLGLKDRRLDPNSEGEAIVWTGSHIFVRCWIDPRGELGSIMDIWSDLDPSFGNSFEEEFEQ